MWKLLRGVKRIDRRNANLELLEQRSYFAGVGAGLVGDYYADQAFTNLAAGRTDQTVNFTWPAAPATNVPADKFSARWTGQILATFTQTFTFYTTTAGGVRLTVNGQKIIDNWTSHGSVENKGTIALTAGKYYNILLEYREDNVGLVKLSWSSPSTPKQIIPKTQLYEMGTAPISDGWIEGNVNGATGGVRSAGSNKFSVSAAGSPGTPTTPSFPGTPTLAGLTLIDSNTDFDIGTFFNGSTLNIAGGRNYNVRADPYVNIGSVVFKVDGVLLQTQTTAPLAAAGDTNGDYWNWALTPGSHTLVATPYSGANGTGAAGAATTVSFTVVNGSASGYPGAPATTNATGPIGGVSDKLHYVYKSLRGDGQIVARLDTLSNNNSEAGILFRPSLANNSTYFGLTRLGSSVVFESRTSTGATARASAALTRNTSTVWLKLVRDGNTVSGYISATGGASDPWLLVGSAGADLSAFGFFGMGAASYDPAFAATFSNVSVKPTTALGGNLNSQSDRVQDLAFVDLVKTTRGFYNTAGRKASNGMTDFASTDANGWPTENFSFTGVDNSEYGVAIQSGTYHLAFKGPAGTIVSGSAGVSLSKVGYDAGTGISTYNVNVGSGVLKLTLTFSQTSGQVKNIRLLQPGYTLDNTPTFTNAYINLLKTTGPNTLRFMDWVKTNGKQDVNWTDRPKVTDATQAKASEAGGLQPLKGIAWEYCIELANALGRNVWINVPAHATDDYVTNLAKLFRDKLRPDLAIYVEHSNEVWNAGFEQYTYNKNAAIAEVSANPGSNLNWGNPSTNKQDVWANRRHARRTKQISDLFRAAFTSAGFPDPINRRVRVVLGGQVSNIARFDDELAYLKQFYGDPKNYLYGISVAPYFNVGQYNTANGSATKAQILAAMNTAIDGYQNNTTLSSAFSKASSLGLHLLGYEGGPDTYGAANVSAKRQAQIDPAMQGIIARYLNVWYSKGGDLFNFYTLGARSYNTPYGDWSITESYSTLSSAKVKGFQQIRDAIPLSTGLRGVFA